MEKIKKYRWIIILALLILGIYLSINYYFIKKIQFLSFEECLSIVSDKGSNWETRKDTIKYCNLETQ